MDGSDRVSPEVVDDSFDSKVGIASVDTSFGSLPLPDFSSIDGSGFAGARFVVLGVGNPIMGDDGIGLTIFARLQGLVESRPAWSAAVEAGDLRFVEGGTGGMELVPVVQESDYLLILDSVAGGAGRRAGDALRLSGDHVPRLLSMKMSPHQVGLLDILTSARLTGREPSVLEVVGVVGENMDLRLGLSDAAAGGIERAVEMAAEILDQWLD